MLNSSFIYVSYTYIIFIHILFISKMPALWGAPMGGRTGNIWVTDVTPPQMILVETESLDRKIEVLKWTVSQMECWNGQWLHISKDWHF